MRDLLAFLSGFAVIGMVWGLLVLLKRVTRRSARPGVERVQEMDAEYGRDYRGPGRKGEPFFQVGGAAFLVTLVAGFLFSVWFSGLIQPWVDWLVPRSPR